MTPVQTVARWTDWDRHGLDQCLFTRDDTGLRLEGYVIGGRANSAFAARYLVRTDRSLRTRHVQVSFLGGPEIRLAADGEGTWSNEVTQAVEEGLAGCLDVDFAATPATNTLPILRLDLARGDAADIRVAYLSMPDRPGTVAAPTAVPQRYVRLDDRLYRYVSKTSGFTAEFCFDETGIVEDYPGAFRRLR